MGKKGLGLSNLYCKIYFITYNWTKKSIYVKICEGLFSITETTWVRNQRGGSINQLHLTTNKQTWLPKASWLPGDCTASCTGISDVQTPERTGCWSSCVFYRTVLCLICICKLRNSQVIICEIFSVRK